MTITVSKPCAIVLGGAISHIALIENLKLRGYYTVLIDYYDNPPAKIFADEHIKESTLDRDKVLKIAENLDAKLIINTCLDQPITTACFVSEKLGLPIPYTFETALNVTDKVLMKKTMLENGIPTSNYIYVADAKEFNSIGLSFPIIVKPADATGSLGVKKATNLSELNEYLHNALKLSRTNKAIVEEFCEGTEVSFDCFIQNKTVHIIMMREQYKMTDRFEDGMQSIGSITPANISQAAKENVQQIANNIAEAFKLDNTPLLIQAIIKDSNVSIIEVAARIGGGTHVKYIKRNTGFDILNSTVDSHLGLDTVVNFKDSEYFYSTNIIYALPGVFDSIKGYEKLMEQHIIEEFFIYKTKGMEILPGMSSRNRVGAFLVKANNKNELFEKIKTAINSLNVLDIDGSSIMRKDIYLKEKVESHL